jgi:L-lactate dehydrogenase complex protein LldG
MSARDEILAKLRNTLAQPELRFPSRRVAPLTNQERMVVTHASGTPHDLAKRFGEEVAKIYGTYEIVETATEARLALINRLLRWMGEEKNNRKGAKLATGQERSILGWAPDKLPIANLAVALQDLQLNLVVPDNLRNEALREQVRHIRYGISSVDAAFAATGTMLVSSGFGANRAASLLPLRHIALIPFSRLYPTIEAWLSEQRQQGNLADRFRTRANHTLITGPSKSADIEMNLTLGVHGPKFVHVILFDDRAESDAGRDAHYRAQIVTDVDRPETQAHDEPESFTPDQFDRSRFGQESFDSAPFESGDFEGSDFSASERRRPTDTGQYYGFNLPRIHFEQDDDDYGAGHHSTFDADDFEEKLDDKYPDDQYRDDQYLGNNFDEPFDHQPFDDEEDDSGTHKP